jgi:hypothetical protein
VQEELYPSLSQLKKMGLFTSHLVAVIGHDDLDYPSNGFIDTRMTTLSWMLFGIMT